MIPKYDNYPIINALIVLQLYTNILSTTHY